MQTIDELETFLLKHGENIVDMLGGEIDRIELKLKVNKYVLYNMFYIIIYSNILCGYINL